MNIHEYQAKSLLEEYNIPTPKGYCCSAAEQVLDITNKIDSDKWVAKCQVHSGARGKAGGVKLLQDNATTEDFVNHWIGKNLITQQTVAQGLQVNKVLIEPASSYTAELYLALTVDRTNKNLVLITSKEGGMDIEEVSATNPDKIKKTNIDIALGVQPFHAREIGFQLNLTKTQLTQLTQIITNMVQMFIDNDLALVEINPLIINKEGDLCCLDAKINVDSNGLYRNPKIQNFFDPTQEDPTEIEAATNNLNYVSLDGNIGCMVNGAGLAMATMDIIKTSGGEPANFLDIGGNANKETVMHALKIIASENVTAILINIFGGIVRCDMVAEAIIAALQETKITTPIIVRLEGNNADKAKAILQQANIFAENNLELAVKKAIEIKEV